LCAFPASQSFVPFHSFRFCSNLLNLHLFKLDGVTTVRNFASSIQNIAYAGGR
jgi:hypothetical protein